MECFYKDSSNILNNIFKSPSKFYYLNKFIFSNPKVHMIHYIILYPWFNDFLELTLSVVYEISLQIQNPKFICVTMF